MDKQQIQNKFYLHATTTLFNEYQFKLRKSNKIESQIQCNKFEIYVHYSKIAVSIKLTSPDNIFIIIGYNIN